MTDTQSVGTGIVLPAPLEGPSLGPNERHGMRGATEVECHGRCLGTRLRCACQKPTFMQEVDRLIGDPAVVHNEGVCGLYHQERVGSL